MKHLGLLVSAATVALLVGSAARAGNPAPGTIAITSNVPPAVKTCSGTLSAAGQTLDCDVSGTASARVVVTGNFTGTLTSTGSADGTTWSGRLLFKDGVGSLGTNTMANAGASISNGYCVVTGGTKYRMAATTLTAGSATVSLTATASPSCVFINGPTHGSEEEAVRAGRAFNASTGSVSVGANSFLNFSLNNPAGSGYNLFVTLRRFQQSAANVTVFTSRSNPGPISGGTVVTPTNRRNDSANTSVASFSYQVSTTALTAGNAGASGLVPNNGEEERIDVLRMLAPGTSLGYSIGGAGGGLAATASIPVTFAWFEESVN